MAKITRWSVRNPGFTWDRLRSVPANRRAPATSNVDNMTWKLTIILPPKPLRRRVMLCAVSFKQAPPSLRVTIHAGTMPNSNPLSRVMHAVNASTVQSSAIVNCDVSHGFANSVGSARHPAKASATPSAPPTDESNRLSVSTPRKTRARPAPRASRTPISRCLAIDRAKSRLAMLEQASNSTSATPPINTCSGFANIAFERNNPRLPSSRVSRGMVVFLSGFNVECTIADNDTSRAAWAVTSATPALVRPMIFSHHIWGLDAPSSDPFLPRGSTRGWELKGRNRSGLDCTLLAPVNPDGATPMIVTGTMLTLIVRPTTEGEDPKARSQTSVLIRATVGAPIWSSAARIGRPSCGSTWSCSK